MRVHPVCRRIALPVALLCGSVTLAAFSSGCSESSAPINEPETEVVIEDTVPAMSDFAEEASLTATQRDQIAPALAEWRRMASISEVSEDLFVEDSPALVFVAEVATLVDAAQLQTIVQMAQRATLARDNSLRPDLSGRGTLTPGIRGLFRNLDLTEDQIAELRAALATAHEASAELCDDYQDGVLTEEALREGRQAIRAVLDGTIADILTEEQNARLEQNKVAALSRRLTRMLSRYDIRVTHRVKRLDQLLDLSTAQETAITDVMLAARPSLESLLASLGSGLVTAGDAKEQLAAIRTGVREDVRTELTEEQGAILDALRDMNVPCGRTLHD